MGAAGTAGAEPAVVAGDGFQDEPDAPLAVATTTQGGCGGYRDSIELESKPAKRKTDEAGDGDEL